MKLPDYGRVMLYMFVLTAFMEAATLKRPLDGHVADDRRVLTAFMEAATLKHDNLEALDLERAGSNRLYGGGNVEARPVYRL